MCTLDVRKATAKHFFGSLRCLLRQRSRIFQKLCETAARIDRNVFLLFIDEAVCEQEYGHSERLGHHILRHVVADHQTFFCPASERADHFLIVVRIRLAVVGIFVGGIQLKIGRRKPRPLDSAFCRNFRKQRIGRKSNTESGFLQFCDCLCSFRIEAAGRGGFLEFDPVKFFKYRFILRTASP